MEKPSATEATDNASPPKPEAGDNESAVHLNIKVTDGSSEVFFKINRKTQMSKLMKAFCGRQGKELETVRFLYDGTRVQPGDTPNDLDLQDGDYLEVHQEQIGGAS